MIRRTLSLERMNDSLGFVEDRLRALEHATTQEDRDDMMASLRAMIADLRNGVRHSIAPSTCSKDVPFTRSVVYTFTDDGSSPFRITKIRRAPPRWVGPHHSVRRGPLIQDPITSWSG